eukprot:scaffold24379_cov115-Skeletonema_dohrnii-CCMP3373.AAC.2
MSRPLSNELLVFCQSDSLSEEGLREIIERHALTGVNHPCNYISFLVACRSERVTDGIIRCLLEYFPDAASAIDKGWSPLHCACRNPNMTLKIIQLLIDAAPDSVSSVNSGGSMPLHCLCYSENLDDAAAIEILNLIIEKYPEAVRHANSKGYLPIHIASKHKSTEFCRVLIEAYPGSERMSNVEDELPLHRACTKNSFAAVQYLYKLYPDAINHTTTTEGLYPIHYAIRSKGRIRDDPIAAVDIVKYLLDCDPNVKFQKVGGIRSLLHCACFLGYNGSTIDVGIQIIKAIYDAHPEAIDDNRMSNIQSCHERVRAFIDGELVHARQAKDRRLMTTPDEKGQLPLHTALQNNVRLGSIKLLVKGNTPAVQSPDNSGALPLHIAWTGTQLSILLATLLDMRSIALLLDKFDAVSVSKRNAHEKLPIDLLWESNEVEDKESVEYTESVFRLLTAYPETVMNICIQQQQSASANCPTSSGKKRKFGNE